MSSQFLAEPIQVVGLIALLGVFAWIVVAVAMGWWRAFAGSVAVLVVLLVGLVAVGPASAAPLNFPNPNNPIGSPSIFNNQLPSCASITGAKADDMAGQGWTGDWQMPSSAGLRNGWAVLMLPCWNPVGATGPTVTSSIWVLNDSGAYTPPSPTIRIVSAKYWCDGTTQNAPGMPINYSGGIPNSSLGTWISVATTVAPTFCISATSTVTRIDVVWAASYGNQLYLGTATWRPQTWTDGVRKAKPTAVGNIPLPGGAGEVPILCPYAINNSTVLDALGSFFITFGPWWACLFTPTGWDRSDQVGAAYMTTGVSRVGDVFAAGIPLAGVVFCGDVVTLPLWGNSAVINTCDQAAAVPGYIKLAVAGVSVLAVAYLFYRRFQWTVKP